MEPFLLAIAGTSTVGVLAFGFILGLKHATEADHLVAITTVVSERKGLARSAHVGALWGLGHTISLFAAGIAVLVLNLEIGPRVENSLELCVGIMLALLGINVLRKLLRGETLHFHTHGHGPHSHTHLHIHGVERSGNETHHGFSFSPKAVLIGMVHGMAGSAALMLLVIPTIGSRAIGLLYILLFGVGSIAGMGIMTLLVGLPFHLTALRFTGLNTLLQGVAAIAGIAFGLWVVYERGFA